MILFIYGEETYQSSQKLNEIKNKFIREVDPSTLNLAVLDGEKISIADLQAELSASPFMAKRRMAVIKNILKNKNKDVVDLIEDLIKKDSDNIIVLYENSKPKESALFKKLKKTKYAQEFAQPDYKGLISFIQKEAKKRGGRISPANAQLLASRVENSVWTASNELDKLIAHSDGREITAEDIALFVKAPVEDDIFRLIDSIATKNKVQAIKLIEDQFVLGQNEMYLLSMMIRQFRILIQIRDILDSSGRVQPAAIAKQLGIHPFVAKKSLAQAEAFTIDYLKSVYRYLLSLDKSFKNSYADPKALIETFVVKL